MRKILIFVMLMFLPLHVQAETREEIIIPAEPNYYIDYVDGCLTHDSIKTICNNIGKKYGIQPELLQAIAWNESRYEINASNDYGAQGLCQVVSRFHTERIDRLNVTDIYDPYNNVLLCADIIKDIQINNRYGNDINYVLMAYNMGEAGAMNSYLSGSISGYARAVLKDCQILSEGGVLYD